MPVNNLVIPYDDFQQGDVMDDSQFDANNEAIRVKVNEIITIINTLPGGSNIVDTTSAQSIDGIKTFVQNVILPNPTIDTHAATKAYVDSVAAGVVLGDIPDNSLVEDKMAAEMKKQAGGVAPYDQVLVPDSEDIAVTSTNHQVPATVKDGQTKPKVKGLTAMNLFKNGDVATSLLSDDTNTAFDYREDIQSWGFSSSYSTLTTRYRVEAGKTYFMYCKLKDTSVGRIRSIYLRHDDETFQFPTPTVEDSLKMSGSFVSNKTGLGNFKITESTVGLIERDYQLFIPVSDLGLDFLTEEQLTALGDAGFFKGIKNYDEVITSVNKNEFDITQFIDSNNPNVDVIVDGGRIQATEIIEGSSVFWGAYRFELLKGQEYALSWDCSDADANFSVYIYDGGYGVVNSGDRGTLLKSVSMGSLGINTATFTTIETNHAWIGFYFSGAHPVSEGVAFDKIQLNRGNARGDYVDHKKSTVRISGKSVTDGTSDSSNQWLTEDTYLKPDDVTALVTSPTNVNYVVFNKPLNDKWYGLSLVPVAIYSESGRNGIFADDTSVIGVLFNYTTTQYGLVVDKSKYASLQEAKDDLQNTYLVYPLAVPQPRTDSEVLTVFEDGVIQSAYLPSELILEGAANNEAQQRQSNIEAIADVTNILLVTEDRFVPVKPNRVIPSSSWNVAVGVSPYQSYADIYDKDIKATDSVDVNFTYTSIGNATNWGIGATEAHDGFVRVLALEVTSNITVDLACNLVITRGV